jgi:diguanylate cyclase (GGDEF)-like protein/PAS domain S-box-containing protein
MRRRAAARRRARTQPEFRALADSAPTGIFRLDPSGAVTYTNPELRQLHGLPEDADPQAFWAVIHPQDRAMLERLVPSGPAGDERRAVRYRILSRAGVRWLEARTAPLLDEHGALTGCVGSVLDVTDETEARALGERLTSVVDATSDVVATTDTEGRIRSLNPAGHTLLGIPHQADLTAYLATDFFPDDVREALLTAAVPHAVAHGSWRGETVLRSADGHDIPVSQVLVAHRDHRGRVAYFSTIIRDIREQKRLERRLEEQAMQDALTGLPNRTLLRDRLDQALARTHRTGERAAVLFIDLDRFKVINDDLGHAAGDALLIAMARRIRGQLRGIDTAARVGGDEFVVLCQSVMGPDEALQVGERLLAALREPLVIAGQEVVVTPSIGVRVTTADDRDPDAVVHEADLAMYLAKERGKARCALYEPGSRQQQAGRLAAESELRRAITAGQIVLHYQPVVSLAHRRIVGVEALARWQHPERGLLPPAAFLPIAQDTGLIVPLGRRLVGDALAALAGWQRLAGDDGLTLGWNVSPLHLEDPTLVDDVVGALEHAGVAPRALRLEVTETVLLGTSETAHGALRRLREHGVSIATDEFGTGFGSLARLKHQPVDALKVAPSFVSGLGRDPYDTVIVAAVVRLARELELAVIADGVEHDLQLEWLAMLGCDVVQGPRVCPPVPVPAITDLLARARDGDLPLDLPDPTDVTAPAARGLRAEPGSGSAGEPGGSGG